MKKLISILSAFLLCAVSYGANVYTNSFVRDGVTYAQRGGLTVKDYVVTNINEIGGGKVESVNGKTGVVELVASDVGALPITGGSLRNDKVAEGATLDIDGGMANWDEGIPESGGVSIIGGGYGNGGTIEIEGGYGTGGMLYIYPPNGLLGNDYGIEIKPYGGVVGGGGFIKVNGTNVMDAIAAVDSKVENAVLPTNPAFSNAVLAVGLNIDTNSVAVLNEIADTFGGFPIEGTATTVGGLLTALAAAVAWLKKNKADKSALDELAAKVEYPLYAVPSTGVLKDRALNTTSLASVTVPENFTDLLIRASVASSLSVTMPEAITKYGDTFPGEAGEYLITITKTGASEAYVRTIKLEEVA